MYLVGQPGKMSWTQAGWVIRRVVYSIMGLCLIYNSFDKLLEIFPCKYFFIFLICIISYVAPSLVSTFHSCKFANILHKSGAHIKEKKEEEEDILTQFSA